ncbi:MAG: PEP-CTERM sorting domain-containing protein [Fimbriimonas sp.]
MGSLRAVRTLLATALGLGASAASAQTFVQWGVNHHYYAAIAKEEALTWTQAKAESALLIAPNGLECRLVGLDSAEENAFVFSLVKDRPEMWVQHAGFEASWGPWVGLSQVAGASEPDGGWVDEFGTSPSYIPWRVGEPNNSFDGVENRAHYASPSYTELTPFLNDFPDDPSVYAPGTYRVRSYIVEAVPEPSSLLALGALAGLMVRRRRTRGLPNRAPR